MVLGLARVASERWGQRYLKLCGLSIWKKDISINGGGDNWERIRKGKYWQVIFWTNLSVRCLLNIWVEMVMKQRGLGWRYECVSHEPKYSSPLFAHIFAFHSFSHLWSTIPWRQMILLLMYCQQVKNSLRLQHSTYIIHLTSSHHVGILSSHIITRRGLSEYSTGRYFWERP